MADELGIELPKSRLALRDGALQKSSHEGKLIALHPLDGVQKVSLMQKTDYSALFLALGFVITACISYQYIDNIAIRAVGVSLSGMIAVVFCVVSRQAYLRLECDAGMVDYKLSDDEDEATGFYLSLKQELSRREEQRRLSGGRNADLMHHT
ncbi:MAG TPA: hypothetical protein VGP72_12925 [Planctomycetota bacterium]|jgi:hypothetical protein